MRIETSHICVIGGGPTATETLKNLVLPNCGEFTVVDDAKVEVSDLGNNFFVTKQDLGRSRAEVVMENMIEMNPAVKGNFVVKSAAQACEDMSFFDNFTIVVATQLYGDVYSKLADYLFGKQVPLLAVRTNGFLGGLRLQLPELCVVESHADDDRTDLYCHPEQLEIFPELKEFFLSYDLNSKDSAYVEDIPAPAIMAQKTLEFLKKKGSLPSGFSEGTAFKESMLKGMTHTTNFPEAAKLLHLAYNIPRIGADTEAVLKDPSGEKPTKEGGVFWVLVRALRDFIENEGKGKFLPVSTKIPDFHTDPKSYVTMKQIYKKKAEADCARVGEYLKKRLVEIGMKEDSVDEKNLQRFVKNCRYLHVETFRSLKEECESPLTDEIQEKFWEWSEGECPIPKPKLIEWYLAFRGMDAFHSKNGRLPGSNDKWEDDKKELGELVKSVVEKINLEDAEDCQVVAAVVEECCRYGGSEPHVTAAFMGGVASQAALKIILEQYYPFNHTFIYEGIHCQCLTLKC